MNVDGLDINKGMRIVGGNKAIYIRILKKIPPTLEQLNNDLRQAAENVSLNEIAVCTHAIKGVLYNVGADLIGDQAKEVEIAAKKDAADVAPKVDALLNTLTKFQNQLSTALLEQ